MLNFYFSVVSCWLPQKITTEYSATWNSNRTTFLTYHTNLDFYRATHESSYVIQKLLKYFCGHNKNAFQMPVSEGLSSFYLFLWKKENGSEIEVSPLQSLFMGSSGLKTEGKLNEVAAVFCHFSPKSGFFSCFHPSSSVCIRNKCLNNKHKS